MTPSRLAATAFAVLLAHASAIAAPTAPDATETLYWQSTTQLATPEAYRAYLATYPQGFFATLAQAALKASGSSSHATPVSPAAPANPANPATPAAPAAPAAPASLTPLDSSSSFTQEAEGGAVSFDLGQHFDGPVAVTVGRLGARRQLVLPPGHWIALAAQDEVVNLPSAYAASTGSLRIRMGTATFGQFDGRRLAALMRYTYSQERAYPVNWTAYDNCQKLVEPVLQTAPKADHSGWREECAALGVQARPLADGSPASAETLKSLGRLNATVSGPALVGVATFSERQRGHLRAMRYQWPAGAATDWTAAAIAASPARADYAERYWTWFQTYRAAASLGYTNDFEGELAGFQAN